MNVKVYEIFDSFQGEGVHTGLPTTFIRLAGCNLNCKWCDTSYARDMKAGKEMSTGEIIDKVEKMGIHLICLTGGEPLLQEGSLFLVKLFIEEGYRVDIETNGSMDILPFTSLGENVLMSVDKKLPSSKEEDSFFLGNLKHMRLFDQLKFIVADEKDLSSALSFIEQNSPSSSIIFTPVNNEGGERIAKILLKDIERGKISENIRLMIQTHKVIWSTDKRGV